MSATAQTFRPTSWKRYVRCKSLTSSGRTLRTFCGFAATGLHYNEFLRHRHTNEVEDESGAKINETSLCCWRSLVGCVAMYWEVGVRRHYDS
jgi:hypothetical protein